MSHPALYGRWQSGSVENALKIRRVIILAGPRQCGKTTLARALADTHAIYHTLDSIPLLEAARADPHGFVQHDDNLMIVDEVQRAPELLLAIKMDVDQNPLAGRFLLTGSANVRTLPNVRESLAGRVSMVRLRPLALGEVHGTPPRFLDNAFHQQFNPYRPDAPNSEASYTKDSYISLALRGGYPEAMKQESQREVRRWHEDYISALLEHDLQDVVNIRRKNDMLKLLECLAAWSSKYMDVSSIGSGLSIQRPTIETYINALETLFLVERIRPWIKTDYDRVGKKDKLFMTDTGLMASILDWTLDKVRLDGDKNGKLLETFVFTQLAAIIDASDKHYGLFHYRDRAKREIDFLIENDAGDYLGIEVKAGTAVSGDSFRHLTWFRDNLVKGKAFIGIVLYTGDHVLSFGDGMWAVPISALWG